MTLPLGYQSPLLKQHLVSHGFCNIADSEILVKNYNVVKVNQVHGSDVLLVDERFQNSHESSSALHLVDADAIISLVKDIKISVLTADCAPIIAAVYDHIANRIHAIAVIHAGWRGAFCGVIENTIRRLQRISATLEKYKIVAAIGPAIGCESYFVKEDFIAVAKKAGVPDSFFVYCEDQTQCFDLTKYCEWLLRKVDVDSVDLLDYDTCQLQEFYSHRRAEGALEKWKRNVSWVEIA